MSEQSDQVYPLLSEEWLEAARRVRGDYDESPPTVPLALRVNLVVTDQPDGRPPVAAHLDTTGEVVDVELDHLDSPDVTVTLEWQTARDLLVEGTPQSALAAFFAGRIKVDGDITKLLGIQATGELDPRVLEVFGRLRALTA